jgi:hypothetical protein
MAIVPIAPWLNGLQVIALLVTGDLECTAESLRREDESADTRRVLTADETRTRARRMLAEMRDDLHADKTRKGLEKFLASGLPNRPPAHEVGGDGSKMSRADRLAAFKGDMWAWGGPSLRNLELQCGSPSLVSEAVQVLSNAAPRLGSCDQHRRPIDPALWTTHHLEEQPEGFLQLVRPGRPGQAPVGSGIVPSFSASDLLTYVRQSLRSNPRFSDAVSLADRLADDGERLPPQAWDPSDAAASQSEGGTGLDRVRAVMEAITADRKQLRRADFDAMVREFVGPRTNAVTLEALWLELAPEGWRRPGQGSPPAGLMVDWKGFLSRK